MSSLFFWIFSVVAIGGGVLAISMRHALYCALALVTSFVAVAGLYFQLNAPFPGVLQVLLYAGAIMVLMIFVIMFLNAPPKEDARPEISKPGLATAVFLLVPLAAVLIGLVWGADLPKMTNTVPDGFGGIREVGKQLFTSWTYPFEIVSLLIIAAMVGAVVMARKRLD